MKKLSYREEEIMLFVAKGYTAKEIAKLTGLGPKTIESYITNAKKKLKAKNSAHAVYLIYRESN